MRVTRGITHMTIYLLLFILDIPLLPIDLPFAFFLHVRKQGRTITSVFYKFRMVFLFRMLFLFRMVFLFSVVFLFRTLFFFRMKTVQL